MIYDEKMHYDLVFNEIQTVGYSSAFSAEYERKKREQAYAVSNGKPVFIINNFKELGLSCLLIAIAFVIGIACRFILPCGKAVIFHMVAAAAFIIAGLVTIKSNTKYTHLAFKDPLHDNVCGALLLAEAAATIIMWFNLPFKTDWECNFFIGGTWFVTVGMVILAGMVINITKKNRLYTRSVNATCIGYVRKKTVSTDDDGHTHIRWYNSPVFRYNVGGSEIIAFYDTLSRGIDSRIPMGPHTIDINEEQPGAIYNPHEKRFVGALIGGLILLAIGCFLIAAVVNGHVHGSGISY